MGNESIWLALYSKKKKQENTFYFLFYQILITVFFIGSDV